MNAASKKLSEELYKLSDWEDPAAPERYIIGGNANNDDTISCPLYTLGFLLRKLPFTASITINTYGEYLADAAGTRVFKAKTPEDAACKLAIELFKQGVLK